MAREEKTKIEEQCLLQRTGTPEEVATAALFLIRDADYMTGSVLRMDGGFVLGSQKVPPMPEGILGKEQ